MDLKSPSAAFKIQFCISNSGSIVQSHFTGYPLFWQWIVYCSNSSLAVSISDDGLSIIVIECLLFYCINGFCPMRIVDCDLPLFFWRIVSYLTIGCLLFWWWVVSYSVVTMDCHLSGWYTFFTDLLSHRAARPEQQHGSRSSRWQHLLSLQVRGYILYIHYCICTAVRVLPAV
jgi:hypothetical protein